MTLEKPDRERLRIRGILAYLPEAEYQRYLAMDLRNKQRFVEYQEKRIKRELKK